MLNFPDSALLVFPAFIHGLALSLGLIVAIGAQNAFVLRQGLRREHVGTIVLFCAVADGVLIAAGVLGMAQALGDRPGLARALSLAGAAFLIVYGVQALRRARNAHQLEATQSGAALRRGAAVAQAAAFTLLNPHVYLDTVLLVGSIGAQQPVALRAWFVAGAGGASLFWFGLLGYPYFTPRTSKALQALRAARGIKQVGVNGCSALTFVVPCRARAADVEWARIYPTAGCCGPHQLICRWEAVDWGGGTPFSATASPVSHPPACPKATA